MSLEQNKAVTRRYIDELWNTLNPTVADQIVAANLIGHTENKMFSGLDALKQRIKNLSTQYSNVRFTIEDQIAEGDKVVIRWTMRGTHTGESMGADARGKQVTVSGTNTFRLADGKIAEIWVNADDLGELKQLGVRMIQQ